MSTAFNLLDEPWLPVRMSNGQVRELGLLELFERSGEVGELAETNPTSLIAQYRLLLAITHRALTEALGTWKDRDRAKWYRVGLPVECLRDYLEKHREHFWLFHPSHPFMQVAALAEIEETRDRQKPWTQISLASACGNTPILFDHSSDHTPIAISPAESIRALLGFLQFTPGGLVKMLRGADNAGPIANTAAIMPLGETLMQSLCLALHPPSSTGMPSDLPAWEREPISLRALKSDPCLASGPNDRYTRQTRAVLLLPVGNGQVQWLRFAAGVALAEDPNALDPMASYRAGSNGLVRLSFAEGRAFWRDLAALLPDASGKESQPAAVLGWASNLQLELGDSHRHQPLLSAGLSSDQAKLLRWRLEHIVLPVAFLTNSDLAGVLRNLLRKAEDVFKRMRQSAVDMLAETLPDSACKDTKSRARSIFDLSPVAASFFSEVERYLAPVLVRLADGELDGAESAWDAALLAAAEKTWDILRRNLGRSPAALRAEAKAYPIFRAGLPKRLSSATPVDFKELQL